MRLVDDPNFLIRIVRIVASEGSILSVHIIDRTIPVYLRSTRLGAVWRVRTSVLRTRSYCTPLLPDHLLWKYSILRSLLPTAYLLPT